MASRPSGWILPDSTPWPWPEAPHPVPVPVRLQRPLPLPPSPPPLGCTTTALGPPAPVQADHAEADRSQAGHSQAGCVQAAHVEAAHRGEHHMEAAQLTIVSDPMQLPELRAGCGSESATRVDGGLRRTADELSRLPGSGNALPGDSGPGRPQRGPGFTVMALAELSLMALAEQTGAILRQATRAKVNRLSRCRRRRPVALSLLTLNAPSQPLQLLPPLSRHRGGKPAPPTPCGDPEPQTRSSRARSPDRSRLPRFLLATPGERRHSVQSARRPAEQPPNRLPAGS